MQENLKRGSLTLTPPGDLSSLNRPPRDPLFAFSNFFILNVANRVLPLPQRRRRLLGGSPPAFDLGLNPKKPTHRGPENYYASPVSTGSQRIRGGIPLDSPVMTGNDL